MKDELFDDLISSANEMVEIEQGLKQPAPEHVHVFETPDDSSPKQISLTCTYS